MWWYSCDTEKFHLLSLYSLGEMSLHCFCSFSNWFICFYSGFWDTLNILDTRALLDIWRVNIFSHSVPIFSISSYEFSERKVLNFWWWSNLINVFFFFFGIWLLVLFLITLSLALNSESFLIFPLKFYTFIFHT